MALKTTKESLVAYDNDITKLKRKLQTIINNVSKLSSSAYKNSAKNQLENAYDALTKLQSTTLKNAINSYNKAEKTENKANYALKDGSKLITVTSNSSSSVVSYPKTSQSNASRSTTSNNARIISNNNTATVISYPKVSQSNTSTNIINSLNKITSNSSSKIISNVKSISNNSKTTPAQSSTKVSFNSNKNYKKTITTSNKGKNIEDYNFDFLTKEQFSSIENYEKYINNLINNEKWLEQSDFNNQNDYMLYCSSKAGFEHRNGPTVTSANAMEYQQKMEQQFKEQSSQYQDIVDAEDKYSSLLKSIYLDDETKQYVQTVLDQLNQIENSKKNLSDADAYLEYLNYLYIYDESTKYLRSVMTYADINYVSKESYEKANNLYLQYEAAMSSGDIKQMSTTYTAIKNFYFEVKEEYLTASKEKRLKEIIKSAGPVSLFDKEFLAFSQDYLADKLYSNFGDALASDRAAQTVADSYNISIATLNSAVSLVEGAVDFAVGAFEDGDNETVKTFVAKDYSNDFINYLTDDGNNIEIANNFSSDFFKSDGFGTNLVSGISRAILIAQTGPFAFVTAGTSVYGETLEQEYNKNILNIKIGDTEIPFPIDYNKYVEIQDLNTGESTTINQSLYDENGNVTEIILTIRKEKNGNYSVFDQYSNVYEFSGIIESDTDIAKTKATAYGAWDAVQWWLGGKISKLTPFKYTEGEKILLKDFLANSATRAILDTIDSAVEVPVRSVIETFTSDVTFEQAWEQQGGWEAVASQAILGGVMSMGSELIDIGSVKKYNELFEKTNSTEYLNYIDGVKNGTISSNEVMDKIAKQYDALKTKFGVIPSANLDSEITNSKNIEESKIDSSTSSVITNKLTSIKETFSKFWNDNGGYFDMNAKIGKNSDLIDDSKISKSNQTIELEEVFSTYSQKLSTILKTDQLDKIKENFVSQKITSDQIDELIDASKELEMAQKAWSNTFDAALKSKSGVDFNIDIDKSAAEVDRAASYYKKLLENCLDLESISNLSTNKVNIEYYSGSQISNSGVKSLTSSIIDNKNTLSNFDNSNNIAKSSKNADIDWNFELENANYYIKRGRSCVIDVDSLDSIPLFFLQGLVSKSGVNFRVNGETCSLKGLMYIRQNNLSKNIEDVISMLNHKYEIEKNVSNGGLTIFKEFLDPNSKRYGKYTCFTNENGIRKMMSNYSLDEIKRAFNTVQSNLKYSNIDWEENLRRANIDAKYGLATTQIEIDNLSRIPSGFFDRLDELTSINFIVNGENYTSKRVIQELGIKTKHNIESVNVQQVNNAVFSTKPSKFKLIKQNLSKFWNNNGGFLDFSVFSSKKNIMKSLEFNKTNLVEGILDSIPKNVDELTKLRIIYLKLSQSFKYSDEYYALVSKKNLNKPTNFEQITSEIYNQKIDITNVQNHQIVCNNWSEIYRDLLIEAGFDSSKVKIMGLDGDGNHKYVTVDLGNNKLLIADATNAYAQTTDIASVKVGGDTKGFVIASKDYFDDLVSKTSPSAAAKELVWDSVSDHNFMKSLQTLDKKIGYNKSDYKKEFESCISKYSKINSKISIVDRINAFANFFDSKNLSAIDSIGLYRKYADNFLGNCNVGFNFNGSDVTVDISFDIGNGQTGHLIKKNSENFKFEAK